MKMHRLALVLAVAFVLASCGEKLADDRKCPRGTKLMGAAPPAGSEQWCQQEDKRGHPVKDGPCLSWYEGHKDHAGQFRDGKEEGRWTWWHKNGRKSTEGEYRTGRLEGVWTTWYDNGQKHVEDRWRNGVQDGQQTKWYTNGQLQMQGEWERGRPVGRWAFRHKDGRELDENDRKAMNRRPDLFFFEEEGSAQ